MKNPELYHALNNFTGTEQWHRHGLVRSFLYTDGVAFFAENAGGGAYWLLDILATEVLPLQKQYPFIAVEFAVGDTNVITATDGDENIIYSRTIDYTDCPHGLWKFYLIDNILLLPSEY